MKVLIAGGGTAGHVNPAIALAGALTPADILFVGTERGVESRIVPAAGYAFESIEVQGFDRSKPWSIFRTGIKALGAIRQARAIVSRFGPDVVVGMGGYVSYPACRAAHRAHVPVVLHEQNIVLGLAHKMSKRAASRIAVSFEETLAEVGERGVFTGDPVAPALVHLDRAAARSRGLERFGLAEGRATLLVFGGSLGARRVNEGAAGLARLWKDRADLQVLHITGRVDHERVLSAVGGSDTGELIYRVVPYVDEMGEAYAVADLALCRGGATTVAELCVVGLGSIVVPYPHHRDRQQERHGRVLERAGAAVVLADADASTERIAEVAEPLLTERVRLDAMGTAARGLGRPDAAERLAEVVTEAAA